MIEQNFVHIGKNLTIHDSFIIRIIDTFQLQGESQLIVYGNIILNFDE